MTRKEILLAYKDGKLTTDEVREMLRLMDGHPSVQESLTEGQRGLWMLQKLSPEMTAYHIPLCFRMSPRPNMDIFREACRLVMEKYHVLRSVIVEEDGVPYRRVLSAEQPDIRQENIAGLSESKLYSILVNRTREPLSLEEGPLVRFFIMEESEDSAVILINIHHIVFDGSSIQPFLGTLLQIYGDLLNGKQPSIIETAADYAEFTKWEAVYMNSKEGEEDLAYWKEQCEGMAPVLELTTDHPRPVAQSFAGQVHTMSLSTDVFIKLKAMAQSYQVNRSVLLLAIFKMLLYRYTGQNDITVGMPTARRGEEKFEDSVGYFMNMIPIRSLNLNDKRFNQFVKELQSTVADGIDHSNYPFPALVRELKPPRIQGHAPVVQTVFTYQNFASSTTSQSLQQRLRDSFDIEFIDELIQAGDHDLELEVYEREDHVQINFKYNPDIFEASTISRMANQYQMLVDGVVLDSDLILDRYSIVDEGERNRLTNLWNATAEGFPLELCFHERFEQQAREIPEAIAVSCGESTLTYKELDERSSRLAIHLQDLGVRPDTLVGLFLDRSLELSVALLAVMKAGGAYVPLDPNFPQDRLLYMMDNSRAPFLITRTSLRNKWMSLVRGHVQAIDLDGKWDQANDVLESRVLAREVKPQHLAYVIYTSGSTGKPKGVMVSHQALANFLSSMAHILGLNAGDRLLAITTTSFDIAALELYLPLLQGAECRICATGIIQDPQKLKREIQRVKPTMMQATPALWTMLLQAGWTNEEQVVVLCGGEALPQTLNQQFQELGCEVYNLFGPTETTVWSTVQRIEPDVPLTIGKPIANTQIYIVDKMMQLVPIGVPGELCIAGKGLARGYLNLPELTAEKFVENPFQHDTKLYKTGDAARWLPNGQIHYLGRLDEQVKIRGYRIETSEIEHYLLSFPGIQEAVVVCKEQGDHKHLAAYYLYSGDIEIAVDGRELREHLRTHLPDYMIPAFYIPIKEIPLTPNGKVNRKVLSARSVEIEQYETVSLPSTSILATILSIWRKVLPFSQFGEDTGFFEAGGDSVLAVTVVERIKKELGCPLSVTDLFKYGNPRALSLFLTQGVEGRINEGRADLPHSRDDLVVAGHTNPDYYEDSLAVIGISCRFPGASDHTEFWNNLRNGTEHIRLFTEEELDKFNVPEEIRMHSQYVPLDSSIEGKEEFDPSFFRLSPRDAEMMDPQLRLLLMHSWKAVEDAGYTPDHIPDTAVFMSASNNFYHAPFLNRESKVMDNADEYVSWLMAQSGTIPTMISNKLGFKGPSLFIHSNCSSSLAGLYSAFQSLKAGEVKHALVGGATIFPGSRLGYVHQPGLNFSSDGRIKAFDDSADGMVTGEGVAVVVLKSAVQAIKDGDRIYALIRGIGLNNDGSDKVGFYAPSVKGQAEVIQKVLDNTGIDPESIGYLEAHGTGTKLGDPIEFSALSEVYGKDVDRKGYCGLGSVKTNIGHLDTVAGLAGLIKVALSLYHNELPPTLNFKEPSKHIDLDNSPFYIVKELKSWHKSEIPHRAALSSFGIGGTNAHTILEAFPLDEKIAVFDNASNQGMKYLIPLSAKNKDRLQVYASLLLAFLRDKGSEIHLSDLAYTLQVGRTAMGTKLVILASNQEELLLQLEQFTSGIVETPTYLTGEDQSENEARKWFASDTEGQELVGKWLARGELNKVAELWVSGVPVDWRRLYPSVLPRRISLPTYPFAKQKFNHPVMKTNLGTEPVIAKLHPLLHRNESNLTEVKFSSTFSGREFLFAEHKVKGIPILPGVASLELARAAVLQATGEDATKFISLKHIVWARPIAVEGSNLDLQIGLVKQTDSGQVSYRIYSKTEEYGGEDLLYGQGIAEFRDVAESESMMLNLAELKSLCSMEGLESRLFYETVRSMGVDYGPGYQGIEALYQGDGCILAQLTLPSSVSNTKDQYVLHPSLLDSAIQASIGLHNTSRTEVDKEVKITLPFALEEIDVYDVCTSSMWAYIRFAKDSKDKGQIQKVDIDLADETGRICVRMKGFTSRVLDKDLTNKGGTTKIASPAQSEMASFAVVWEATQPEMGRNIVGSGENTIIIIPDQKVRCHIMQLYPNAQELLLEQDDTVEELALKLSVCGAIKHVIWIFPEGQATSLRAESIVDEQEQGVMQIFRFTKALLKENYGEKFLSWSLATIQSQQVFAGDLVEPTHSCVHGYIATLTKEFPNWDIRLADMPSQSNWPIPDLFLLPFDKKGQALAYREGEWFQQRLVPVNPSSSGKRLYRTGGVYIVIGGAGGLGEVWTEYMLRHYRVKVIWIGRREINNQITGKIARLGSFGPKPEYIQADASIHDSLEMAYQEITRRHGSIHGVVQAALVLNDQSIANMEEGTFRAGLAAKVDVSVRMVQVFKDEPLDFILFFSSVNAFIHPAGQGSYNAGCIFKDAYARGLEQTLNCAVKTVNWGFWGTVGAVSSQAYRDRMFDAGIDSIEPAEAMESLEMLLAGPLQQMAFMRLHRPLVGAGIEAGELISFYSQLAESSYIGLADLRSTSAVYGSLETDVKSDTQVHDEIENLLTEKISCLLNVGVGEIDKQTELTEYGWDSFLTGKLIRQWNGALSIEPNVSMFNDSATLSHIAELLSESIDRPILVSSNEKIVELETIRERSDEFDDLLCKLLLMQLQETGWLMKTGAEQALGFYDNWFRESLSLLERKGLLHFNGKSYISSASLDPDLCWSEWEQQKKTWMEPGVTAQVVLVETMLRALPEILAGTCPATDIMFPDSSMKLVEDIYQNNLIVDLYNEAVADYVTSYVEQRIAKDPAVRIRIIEIGAGTGGTSAKVLSRLKAFHVHISEYCYTDISKAFLIHAEQKYGSDHPYLSYKLFNVEEPLSVQKMDAGCFDLAIATNVLHATSDIRETLRNVKAVLKLNGLLILNEINSNTTFSHLTFGLLEGWWLYKDKALRIPGCPAISGTTWERVLKAEGYPNVLFTNQDTEKWGQQIIVAQSNGVIRQKVPIKNPTKQGGQAPLESETDNLHVGTPVQQSAARSGSLTLSSSGDSNSVVNQRAETQVRSAIRDCVGEALRMDESQINDTESFSDYGVDSIVAVNLVNDLNQKLKLSLATTVLFDYNNVEQLARHIANKHYSSASTDTRLGQIEVGFTSLAETRDNRQEAYSSSGPYGALEKQVSDEVAKSDHVHSLESGQSSALQKETIAIVGMSGRFAKSSNVHELWNHLTNGDNLIEKATRWDLSSYVLNDRHCDSGSFLEDIDQFDPLFFNISEIEALYMDPRQRIFLEESWLALEDAGYAGKAIENRSCGVFAGCGRADYDMLFSETPPPQAFWGNDSSVIPARIAYYLNLNGPAIAIDTACSSSLVAMHLACQSLWSGEIEMALAGGVYLNCTPGIYTVGNRAEMLSPSGRCNTFDESADGFVPGEGAGVIILKRLSDAISDGDHIYGVIRGTGINQDGRTNGITAPSALSQERLERNVYESFGINPEQISMVEAHGTGTKLGDPIEFGAITNAFRTFTDDREYCAIGSIKTNLGHTAHAAGVAGVIKVLLSLQHKQIPPTLNFEKGNPAIKLEDSPFYVNTSLRTWDSKQGQSRMAAVSSFGFSGTNAHMVIEEAPQIARGDIDRPAYLIVLSGKTLEQLKLQAAILLEHSEKDDFLHLGDVSFTLLSGRKHLPVRLVCIIQDKAELELQLRTWLKKGKAQHISYSEINEREVREQPMLMRFGNHCIIQCRSFEDAKEYSEQLSTVAELFLQGYSLDYDDLFIPGIQRRVPIPTLPFSKKRYWISNARKVSELTDRSQNDRGSSKDTPDVSEKVEPVTSLDNTTLAGTKEALDQEIATLSNRRMLPEEIHKFIQSNKNMSALDRLGQCLLLDVFRRMEVLEPGEEWETDALRTVLGIIPLYERLFEALLQILHHAGFVHMNGKRISVSTEWTAEKLQNERKNTENLIQKYPELQAHSDLLTVCIEAYPEILSGKRNHMEVLFPDGSDELVKNIYKDTEGIDFYNRTLAKLVEICIKEKISKDPDARIRILEIGAGTGGTSKFVLQAIEPYKANIQYSYTDISLAFAQAGEREFGSRYPFMEFGVLNIERSPVEQGFESSTVDLVIASNVLHATRNIAATLKQVHTILKPNGIVLLNEITRVQDFNTFTFGLTGGWWLFDDAECRLPGAPVLSSTSWKQSLTGCGFEDVRLINLFPIMEGDPFQHLIVAECVGSESIQSNNSFTTSNEPEESELLLVKPSRITEPRSPLESRIAALWKEILGSDQVGIYDTFQDLGGDSLMLTQLISRLKKGIPFDMNMNRLFGANTVVEMSEIIEEELINRIEQLPEELIAQLLA